MQVGGGHIFLFFGDGIGNSGSGVCVCGLACFATFFLNIIIIIMGAMLCQPASQPASVLFFVYCIFLYLYLVLLCQPAFCLFFVCLLYILITYIYVVSRLSRRNNKDLNFSFVGQ